jgi:hypothetical protein
VEAGTCCNRDRLQRYPRNQNANPAGDFNRSMFIEIFPDPLSPSFIGHEPLFKICWISPRLGVRIGRLQAIGGFYNQPYLTVIISPPPSSRYRQVFENHWSPKLLTPLGRRKSRQNRAVHSWFAG